VLFFETIFYLDIVPGFGMARGIASYAKPSSKVLGNGSFSPEYVKSVSTVC